MNVQLIEKDGFPIFAVIPYGEYEALLDAVQNTKKLAGIYRIISAIESGEETYPLEFVEKLIEASSRLREWRKYRQMTQAQLAEVARLSQGAIASIELGKRIPNMDTARRLAQALSCDIDDLF